MKHAARGVKATPEVRSQAPKRGKYRRHFEGWQLGLLALSIALLALALAMPRGAPLEVVPLPTIDRDRLHREQTDDRARAEHAQRQRLPFEIRALGEGVRRFGRAEFDHDRARMGSELAALNRLLAVARARHTPQLLLELRALQTALFRSALSDWQSDARAGVDLIELGGSFLESAKNHAWLDEKRRLVFSQTETDALFKLRWTELLGLTETSPFAPTQDEFRVYYRALLEHPQAPPAPAELADQARDRARLAYVNALAKRDPDYLAALARGVLHYRLGEYSEARAALQEHLTAHPSGPWALRARNQLLLVLDQQRAMQTE